jgi:VCBS repeat-containing protein
VIYYDATPDRGLITLTNATTLQITTLDPQFIIAGSPAFLLRVIGSNFMSGLVVRWNGLDRVTAFVSPTELRASIPAADIVAGGTASVTVVNPAPGGGTSNSLVFEIRSPEPSIISLSPSSAVAGGPGFTLTVNGANFVDGSVVKWGGSNRTTTFVSATKLEAAITSADIASSGAVSVAVLNPAPGGGTSSPRTFTINALNQVPVANNDAYTTNQNTALTIAAPGVLANDTDFEKQPLTARLVANPSHGMLTLNTNGSFTYTPATNYTGTDSFTYKANDGITDSNVATVTVTVNPINDAPVANKQNVTTKLNTSVEIVLTALDADGDALSYTIVGSPAQGTLTGMVPNLSYTPAFNYYGSDSFTFKASDGTTDSNIAIVTIKVTGRPKK